MSGAIEKYVIAQCSSSAKNDDSRSAKDLSAHPVLSRLLGIPRFALRAARFLRQRIRKQGIRDLLLIGVRFVCNFSYRDFREVYSALALPNVEIVARRHPENHFKYFGKYLARSFSVESRARILANHYAYLNGHVSKRFMRRVVDEQILLWEESKGGSLFSIGLGYPYGTDVEGDLALIFYADSSPLFVMSFTIMPGGMLAMPSGQALFVCRIQGVRGSFDAIRHATKTLGELSPSMLLFSAVRGISNALEITAIVGVSDIAQVCIGGDSSVSGAGSAYDGFWEAVGARRLSEDLHMVTAETAEKPLSMIKSNHRSRVKRRRLYKSTLVRQVEQAFKAACLN